MPSTYDIGDLVRVWGRFSTSTGSTDYQDPTTVYFAHETPAGTLSTDNLSPPGSTASTTIKRFSTGEFYADILATSSDSTGLNEYRWTSTGSLTASQEGRYLIRSRRVP